MPLGPKQLEALKDELNWLGTGAIIAAGFALGAPLLIPFVWLGYEAAYLLFVPDSAWYERRRGRKFDAEVRQRRQALRVRFLPTLLPEDRHRFELLERTRAEIGAQQLGAGESVQEEMLRKLDYLLERFLMFSSKRAEYLHYLRNLTQQETGMALPRRSWRGGREVLGADTSAPAMVDRLIEQYEARIENRRQELDQEGAMGGGEILRKNVEVLEQCRANAAQIGEILRNLTQQMDLVVNTFTLVNGQIRTRPPEQMLTDVQDVVGSSEALAETLRTFAPLDEAVERLTR